MPETYRAHTWPEPCTATQHRCIANITNKGTLCSEAKNLPADEQAGGSQSGCKVDSCMEVSFAGCTLSKVCHGHSAGLAQLHKHSNTQTVIMKAPLLLCRFHHTRQQLHSSMLADNPASDICTVIPLPCGPESGPPAPCPPPPGPHLHGICSSSSVWQLCC